VAGAVAESRQLFPLHVADSLYGMPEGHSCQVCVGHVSESGYICVDVYAGITLRHLSLITSASRASQIVLHACTSSRPRSPPHLQWLGNVLDCIADADWAACTLDPTNWTTSAPIISPCPIRSRRCDFWLYHPAFNEVFHGEVYKTSRGNGAASSLLNLRLCDVWPCG
jgi:hypothetical protein